MIGFLRSLFFPPSGWSRTSVQTPSERVAQYEVRKGYYRAQMVLDQEARAKALDARHIVRPVVQPKLPADNVVSILHRKAS